MPKEIDLAFEARVLAGRKAVDQYRADHSQLYVAGYYKGIHDAHTPLLNTMKAKLRNRGFNSLQEFWDASDLLNVQELGFASRGDIVNKSDQEALRLKWK